LTDGPGIISSTSLPGVLDRHSPYWQLLAGVKLLCELANNASSGTSQPVEKSTNNSLSVRVISTTPSFVQQTTK